jgi:hypothetical protein
VAENKKAIPTDRIVKFFKKKLRPYGPHGRSVMSVEKGQYQIQKAPAERNIAFIWRSAGA